MKNLLIVISIIGLLSCSKKDVDPLTIQRTATGDGERREHERSNSSPHGVRGSIAQLPVCPFTKTAHPS